MTDFKPGDILAGTSGAVYVLGEATGLSPDPGTPCDAAEFGGHPSVNILTGECRCVVCARCGHHTGNSHQGHWWKQCKVLAARLGAELPPGRKLGIAEYMKRTSRDEFHFCCPDPAFGCELEAREVAAGGDST